MARLWLAALALTIVLVVPPHASPAYSFGFRPTQVRKISHVRYGDVQSVVAGALIGGDRRADVFVTALHTLHVYKQRRDGRLSKATVLRVPTFGMNGGGMDIGDLDGDGRPDLAVAAHEGVVVYYQRGDGLSRPRRIILDPPDPDLTAYGLVDVGIADLDGDGRRDMTVQTSVSGVRVVWNEGRGHFTDTHLTSEFGAFAVGNVTRRPPADVVAIGGNEPPGLVRVFKGHRDRTFTTADYVPSVPDDGCGGIHAVAIGDVTNDGRADVVGPTRGCSEVLAVFPREASGRLGAAVWYQLRSQVGETAVVSDMNGDGLKDVVVAHGSHDTKPVSRFGIFPQNASAQLWPERLHDLPDTSHYKRTGLAVASINGDKRPDVLLASQFIGLVYRLHR